MARMADICDKIVSNEGMQVAFLPMTPSDIKAIEDVRRRMKEKSCVIEHGFDYRIAKGIIRKAEFMLTMKHHGIIFAMGLGVPVIAPALDDYYLRKNLGALRLFGQEEFLISGNERFLEGNMEGKIEKILREKCAIKKRIEGYLGIMRPMDGEVIKEFLKRRKQ